MKPKGMLLELINATLSSMKKRPKTITLKQLVRDLSDEERQAVDAEIQYYDILVAFKKARKSKGISQEELARKANINRTTLSKIESGLRNATIDTLMRLARALDMSLELRLR